MGLSSLLLPMDPGILNSDHQALFSPPLLYFVDLPFLTMLAFRCCYQTPGKVQLKGATFVWAHGLRGIGPWSLGLTVCDEAEHCVGDGRVKESVRARDWEMPIYHPPIFQDNSSNRQRPPPNIPFSCELPPGGLHWWHQHSPALSPFKPPNSELFWSGSHEPLVGGTT